MADNKEMSQVADGDTGIGNDDEPFISPVVSSFTVKVKLKVGGEVIQPPIDFDAPASVEGD